MSRRFHSFLIASAVAVTLVWIYIHIYGYSSSSWTLNSSIQASDRTDIFPYNPLAAKELQNHYAYATIVCNIEQVSFDILQH